jgi:CHAT domain-containing protein
MLRPGLTPAAKEYMNAYRKKQDIQDKIRQSRREGQPEPHINSLMLQLDGVNTALKNLEVNLRENDPESLAGFAAPLNPDDLLPLLPADGRGCIADFYFAGEIVILLAYRNGAHVELVAAIDNNTNLKMLAEQTGKWLKARFSNNFSEFEKETHNMGMFLHDRFMCNLGSLLSSRGHWQITMIPHLLTHIFPLHLTPLCETGFKDYFCNKFAVSYAPCIQLALTTALRARPTAFIKGELSAFLLADPAGDLPAGHIEQKHVAENLGNHPWPAGKVSAEAVSGSVSSIKEVTKKMADTGLGLISTHGKFVAGDPYGSGLFLLAGKNKKPRLWSVDEIYTGLQLRKNPVVILSACESGMAFFDEQKEVVALPPAFVCAGAASVVSTFWPVEDVSSSLVVERFVHHLMDPGEIPATALFSAFRDVREMSREDVINYCYEILSDMEDRGTYLDSGKEAYLRLTAFTQRIKQGPDKPFGSPVFWGGFFITGCGWYLIEGKGEIMKKPDAVVEKAMGIAAVKNSSGLFRDGKYKDCVILLEKAIQNLDGMWLGRALLLLGDSLNRSADFETIINPSKAKKHLQKSLKYLNQAYDLLSAEGEDNATLTYCKELSDSISKELKAME